MTKLVSILFLCIAFSAHSQINKEHNRIRIGDEIVKQQVEYKDPGRSGEQVIWNFSRLKPINKEYELSYSQAPIVDDSLYVLGKDSFLIKNSKEDEFIVGTEHQTMYYFRQTDSALFMLGHENSVNLIHHYNAIITLPYPFDYGQRHSDIYKTNGLYSSRDRFKINGTISLESDARGMMILPSNDTLQHVIRIKKLQTYQDADSIMVEGETPLNMEVETFQWYAKGYRYPIFETIRSYNVNVQDTSRTENFKTAFFFPPQEHYYLSDDDVNLAVLDSLWNAGQKDPNIIDPDKPNMEQNKNFAYNFYPNPVSTNLYLEYFLEDASSVSIGIYDISGRQVFTLPEKNLSMGLYQETIDCSAFSNGTFILRLTVNKEVVNEKIIKK